MENKLDFFDKLAKTSTLDICILSDNKILDRLRVKDTGQNIVISKRLNRAFIIPERSDGLHYGFTTMFFYDSDNATPLIKKDKDMIDKENNIYCYGINDDNKIKRLYYRTVKTPDNLNKYDKDTKKCAPAEFQQTTINNILLKGIIDTKIIEDLVKSPENIFEQLKTPIIIGFICLTLVAFMFSM